MHLLHVDDEPLFLELTEIYLNRSGDMMVTSCSSAAEALRLVETEDFDGIISDYQMPGMNGIEFLFELRSSSNNLPFIIFTGRGRQEVVIEALNNGADFYIQKGGDISSQFAELENAIRQAVLKYRSDIHLRQSRQLICDIFHHLPDATYAIDCMGRVIAWNRMMERMAGITAGQVIGRSGHPYAIPFFRESRKTLVDYILHPDEEILRTYSLLRKEHGMIIAETEGILPNGKPIFLRAKASLLYDEKGTVIGSIESVRDITKSKMAEMELISAGEYRRTLIEAHIDPLVTIGSDGGIQDLNAATEALTGMTRDALIGRSFSSLFTDPESAELIYQKTIRSGAERKHSLFIRSPDGGALPVIFYGTVYRGPDGDVRGVFAELHESIPALDAIPASCPCSEGRCGCAEAEREYTLHFDIILHDLGNAVHTARGYMDLLDVRLEEDLRTVSGKMKQAVVKAGEIIRMVGDARRNGSQITIDRHQAVIPLDEVIRNEISHFPGIRIEYGGCDEEVLADDLLGEVIWNLLHNSVKFGGDDVAISIRVEGREDRIILTVTDTGPGIPVDVIIPPPQNLSGRGLCIVRDLVAAYGGELWVESNSSDGDGRGASISLSLQKAGLAGSSVSTGVPSSSHRLQESIQ
nr:PAS domain S-box protein [Methanocalculus taiwanensis]